MSWTGSPSTTGDGDRFAATQVANAVSNDIQNRRAARVVAGHAVDATDCAEMLAMLGLDAEAEAEAQKHRAR